ncbi:amino acid ABC transporter ATP-binding protein [Caballeronia sp. ATUFL_M1_KS5A]|uniref:amino acid ABC transporter ATP-binding protein n=1 Tax=Caballeronia sp. ATUFL_M1_KS5A TaxID=2921778 RepID=UPI0032EAFA9C
MNPPSTATAFDQGTAEQAGTTRTPFVSMRGLKKSYANGSVKVLDGLDLDMAPNDRLLVVGPSGGGKSTLLRCMMGLEDIDEGTIAIDGKPYVGRAGNKTSIDRAIQKQVGMVFQSYTLFPHLTVIGNLMLAPLRSRKAERQATEARAMELLRRFGLDHKAKAYPAELSGGQKQRVAIARALMLDPKLMLFDEVTSALDPELVNEVSAMIVELAETGMPMMIVTHDMYFAKKIATRVVFCAGGKIVEDAPPDEFFNNPKTQRARDFIHNVLHADDDTRQQRTA